MVDEKVLFENDYRKMFENCVSVNFYERKVEETKMITESVVFDGFDWDSDMKDAYSL
jgi:hypothetical protein